jgi:uncharacterized membrane protein
MNDMMDTMDRMMDSMMGGMGLFMLLALILIAVVIGTVIYLAIRAGSPPRRQVEGPRELLERRLAAGEISPDEYYERESALRSGQPTQTRPGRG